MSPELETLDQLQGGDMKLSIIRMIFPDHSRFVRGISAMLGVGEIRLRTADGKDVPRGKWSEVLAQGADEQAAIVLSITDAGARRIG